MPSILKHIYCDLNFIDKLFFLSVEVVYCGSETHLLVTYSGDALGRVLILRVINVLRIQISRAIKVKVLIIANAIFILTLSCRTS